MSDFSLTLYRIAIELSKNLGSGIEARAAKALDAYLSKRDLRRVVIRYLVEDARAHARYEASKVERDATLAKAEAERAERNREIERRISDEYGSAEGHIGSAKPGSVAKTNRCSDCERCRRAWKEEADRYDRYVKRLAEIEQRYEEELRAELWIEWNEELLATEIAMPDGTRTTWGDATLEQHQRRHDMLAANASANMVNAARHAEAIQTLRDTGAPNLRAALEAVR